MQQTKDYILRAKQMLQEEYTLNGNWISAGYNGIQSLLSKAVQSLEEQQTDKQQTLLRWVKAKDRQPDKTTMYFCKSRSIPSGRECMEMPLYNAETKQWHTPSEVVEWLEESPLPASSDQSRLSAEEIDRASDNKSSNSSGDAPFINSNSI